MPEQSEINANIIALLTPTELSKVSTVVCELVKKISGSPMAVLVYWDSDLEILTNIHFEGSNKNADGHSKGVEGHSKSVGENSKGNNDFIKAFVEEFEREQDPLYQICDENYSQAVPDDWKPLYCYEVSENNEIHACLLFANKTNKEVKQLLAELRTYPLALVLSRAWEFSELSKENLRLRGNYEDMENKTRMLEEQTRKLIQDLTMKDSIRTKHVERERLIYSISNVVRSYVNIEKVLETTVEKIGSAFAVNRCLLIHRVEHQSAEEESLQVFEFIKDSPSIKSSFDSKEGIEFARSAFALMRTQDLIEPFADLNHNISRDFLNKLNFRSGLLVPLVLREYSLGTLFLQDCIQARHWSIDDISLIESLADQISVAIENAELHLEQERQAVTDGLTGIANRRSFNKTLAREFERARRYEQPLSLVMLDLDYLKVINDSFGHQAGDEAIKAVARVLKQSSRAVDLAARFGGEEFCLLLPNTELDMTIQLAERLKNLINDIHIEGPGHVSASLGIANYPLHAKDGDSLVHAADAALYQAKMAGRNQVKIACIV